MSEESFLKVYTELYNEYGPRLVVIAASYLQDRSIASDVVADVFLDLWKRRESLSVSEEDLPRYIMQAVKNKCIDANRSKIAASAHLERIHRRAIAEADLRILQNDSITSKIFSDEIRRKYSTTVNSLPPRAKEVFLRSRMSSQTYAEIASQMGISVRKVTSDIQKALAALRDGLKEYTDK